MRKLWLWIKAHWPQYFPTYVEETFHVDTDKMKGENDGRVQ